LSGFGILLVRMERAGGERFGLPQLPSSEIVLHSKLTDAKSRAALRTIAAAFREHRLAVANGAIRARTA
jgi:hypothetical protein